MYISLRSCTSQLRQVQYPEVELTHYTNVLKKDKKGNRIKGEAKIQALDISKAFDRVWHVAPVAKLITFVVTSLDLYREWL